MRPPESRGKPLSAQLPSPRPPRLALRSLAALALAGALPACSPIVFNASGDVARQQGDLVILSTLLMLLIVIPVMVAIVVFAWRYRASNTEATYEPDWDHSTKLELMIWTAPLLIIICLGAITWTSTHLLDPYRTLGRIDKATALPAHAKPVEVEVVALDWKWLFIYPEQGIASVNELVVPTGRPLHFRITASSVMNSFYAPAMAGQIYAMPGMETRLHAVMNKPVESVGFSANYSGAGFSHMRFKLRSVDDAAFARWVSGVKAGGPAAAGTLDRDTYLELEKPSEKVPVMHYAAIAPDLYGRIVDMCVEPGKMCSSEMMAIDANGGLGKAGIRNVSMLTYDKHGREAAREANANPDAAVRRELAWVRALCEDRTGMVPDRTVQAPSDLRSLTGSGLRAPQSIGITRGEPIAPAAAKTAHTTLISRN